MERLDEAEETWTCPVCTGQIELCKPWTKRCHLMQNHPAQKQKEGIQPRQQLSWFKMIENETFEKDPRPPRFLRSLQNRECENTTSVKLACHMACRRGARRSQPGHTCRGSSANYMRTRLQLPERATSSREWTSADVKSEQSHQRKKNWRQTWYCNQCRKHAAEIAARTCQWLKEKYKPCEGRKVKEAKELRPSQSAWKAMHLQPKTFQRSYWKVKSGQRLAFQWLAT